jgi:hypothetical protein
MDSDSSAILRGSCAAGWLPCSPGARCGCWSHKETTLFGKEPFLFTRLRFGHEVGYNSGDDDLAAAASCGVGDVMRWHPGAP